MVVNNTFVNLKFLSCESRMSATSEILEQISKEVTSCTKCPLAKTRCKAVPGEGSPQALVMFIGEAPGKNEDLSGRPFVGDAGRLLERLLQEIALRREDVFIANTVKCRPPGNRDPQPPELEACKSYLDRQIAAINPRVIVTLGRYSMDRYFPKQYISQIHGQYKVEEGRIILPMYHPAAALYDNNGRGLTMAKFKEDGLLIPELLEKAKEIARTEIWGLSYAAPANGEGLEVAESTPPVPSPVLQPTLQPAVETRPGEVTPLERLVLPEVPVKNGRKSSKVNSSEIAPTSAKPTDVLNSAIEASETAQGTEVLKPKRRSRAPRESQLAETSDTAATTDTLHTATDTGATATKKTKKKDGSAAEQLTLF
jgi:DNA polymerase